MKIVILGGTGLIGSKVVNLLRARSHEVVAASPSKDIDSITGKGLTDALTEAQVVVHVTNAPSWKDKPCWNSSKLQRVTFSLPKKKKAWATTLRFRLPRKN